VIEIMSGGNKLLATTTDQSRVMVGSQTANTGGYPSAVGDDDDDLRPRTCCASGTRTDPLSAPPSNIPNV
jgi:hypothetical protein